MKTAAVIAEYNPFHNGHLHHLDTVRRQSGADQIIIVMSGDFVQRGAPAILDKYERCRMALENGADLVFELPVYFALGSAEYFASGAVSLIDKLGVTDFLHFGSECGDIGMLGSCAAALTRETDPYRKALSHSLKEGRAFPSARTAAINAGKDVKEALSTPNNILGIEYIKALRLRNSPIIPATIPRNGCGYHSSALKSGSPASANAIRSALQNGQSGQLPALMEFVPDTVYRHLCRAAECRGHSFVFADDFSQLLRYKLLQETHISPERLSGYYDVTRQLADTFLKNMGRLGSFSDFILACKSKNLTYTRISRCLMHLLLDMKQETIDLLKASDYCLYARLLGFSRQGQSLLKQIKANASIPIVTKLPRALKMLNGAAADSLKADIYASAVYQSVKSARAPFPSELTREIIKT